MSLDSKQKRANAARVARPWMRSRWPVGLSTQPSRIASGHGYGGNTITSSAAEVISNLTFSTDELIRFKPGTAI